MRTAPVTKEKGISGARRLNDTKDARGSWKNVVRRSRRLAAVTSRGKILVVELDTLR